MPFPVAYTHLKSLIPDSVSDGKDAQYNKETIRDRKEPVSYTHLKEDIVNKDGKVIVKADTQIERGVTGKDGKVTFTSDLPLGQYYVCLLYTSDPVFYISYDGVYTTGGTDYYEFRCHR